MTKSPRVTLVLTAGGRGGNGKTTALVALTDYLASKGIKQTLIDCDTENAGQAACFSHWPHGKGNALDLRNPIDRDRLLTDCLPTPLNPARSLSWLICLQTQEATFPDGSRKWRRWS